ncbi:MAG TPA: hypothetical protein VGX25_32405 [Actinophytocola sp.]|uniref:hypothetical protein n=1 Tax=Actinophytocola sp. TaxID=1872138 RepID=UPI002DDCAF3F|nr:hypothetical protein [Actinophytocola sp.]HEV2784114.1 hypothetical protein [Actinophytocola sp.]
MLLAEDAELLRDALTSLLSRVPDLEVVAAVKCQQDRCCRWPGGYGRMSPS